MKKLSALFLVAGLCCSMAACSQADSKQATEIENKDLSLAPAASLEFNKIDGQVKNPVIYDGIFQLESEDGLITLMNMEAKPISASKYKIYTGFSQGYAFVKDENDDKYYIDLDGKKAIERVDGKTIYFGEPFKNDRAKISFQVMTTDLASDQGQANDTYIDSKGNILAYQKPMYEAYEIFDANQEGAFYTDQTLVGLLDPATNKAVTSLDYLEVSGPFVGHKALAVNKEGETLLIDPKGTIIENLSKKYEGKAISSYSISPDGIVLNFEKDPSVILSLDGKAEIATNYMHIGSFVDGFAKCGIEGKYGLIDAQAKEVIPVEYQDISNPYQHKVLLKKENQWYICKFMG